MTHSVRRDAVDATRAPLTPRTIVEGALSLADSDGLGAVTIRRLATELGVTPMALYWHFRNKDELLDGMIGEIFEQVDLSLDAAAPWQEQLRALLRSMVDVLRTHPATALLLSTRTTTAESSLRATEVMLDILRRGGFSPTEATQIARHALGSLTNLVSGLPGSAPQEVSQELLDAQRRARLFLVSLPPDRYPRMVEAAGPLSECEDSEGYLAFGLDLLLAGIEAMAARKQDGSSPDR